MSGSSQAKHLASPKAYLVVIVAGILAGIVGSAFRVALTAADDFRIAVVEFFHTWPLVGWIVPVLGAALAVVIARYLVVRVPEGRGQRRAAS